MKVSLALVAIAATFVAAGALAQPTTTSKPAPVIKPGPGAPAAPAAQPKTEQPKAEVPKVEPASWVELKTSMGTIVIEVDGAKAPISAANFLTYVQEGYYDGTVFHRIIPTFMVQGGGFTVTGSNPDVTEKKPTHPQIKNEWQNGLKNKRGTVAMARTPIPDSASSQFFINVVDNAFLDQDRGDGAGYAVFGKVVSGMDVVDKIKAVKTNYHKLKASEGGSAKDVRDIPDVPVVIEKARKLSEDEAKKLVKEEPKPAAAPDAKPAAPETKPSTPPPAPAPAPKPAAPSTSPAPTTPPKGPGR